MVSIPFRYEEPTYDPSFVEPKYAYADVYSGYAFDQPPPKSCLHTFPIYPESFSDNIYSNWVGAATDGYYPADHQVFQDQYMSGYAYDTTSTTYMTKGQAMEYEFNNGFSNNPQFLLGFAPGYSSPNFGSTSTTAWSPSEPSVASLSPPSDTQWEEKSSVAEYPLADEADEILQGLGLYDCPELAADHGPSGQLYASYSSPGRGLKLEESFEFKEEYSDDEDEDEDEEGSDED
ncbi:hypothetical protein TWF481_011173 [Arthrobotrys musiformis]|uniref:Uncharacterized protein n=1 Tax=Arthrobotrys musiformis TaxID=47236 RepID=A0AAV9VXN8_9PEZI